LVQEGGGRGGKYFQTGGGEKGDHMWVILFHVPKVGAHGSAGDKGGEMEFLRYQEVFR